MKTTTLLERLFFTSYVMMSDLKFQACRKWMIIMRTELGVRGGPSLSLSLARAETILVIGGHLHWCGPDAVGSLGALAWPLGSSWFVLPVPGMWACCFGFVCLPRAVGIFFFFFFWIIKNLFPNGQCCGNFAWLFWLVMPVCGCWVLFFSFDWLFVLIVPVCG